MSPSVVHPLTKKLMKEEGIVLDHVFSKGLSEVPQCGNVLVGLHMDLEGMAEVQALEYPCKEFWPIEDPITYAGQDQLLAIKFREVRDKVRKQTIKLYQKLRQSEVLSRDDDRVPRKGT